MKMALVWIGTVMITVSFTACKTQQSVRRLAKRGIFMNENVAMTAKFTMLQMGVPIWQLEERFEEIYVAPRLDEASKEMDDKLARIKFKDLMPVLVPFLAVDILEATRRTAELMRELFGVRTKPEIKVSSETDAMQTCYVCRGCEVKAWNFLVNTRNVRDLPIDILIGAAAHEVWHAYQQERALKWRKNHQQRVELITTEVTRDMLYALNGQYIISPSEDLEAYAAQLVEAEAYCLTKKVCAFLRRAFLEAYRRGEIPRRMYEAIAMPMGAANLLGYGRG